MGGDPSSLGEEAAYQGREVAIHCGKEKAMHCGMNWTALVCGGKEERGKNEEFSCST